jgi:hypothetical protein
MRTTLQRQRGLSLLAVTLVSALVAAAAMAAIWSMRYERNLFGEAWTKLVGESPTRAVFDTARQVGASAASATGVTSGSGGAMRKCVIDGKPVISNTDCKDSNKTSRTIEIHDTRGFEAPKAPPPPPPASASSDPALDKIIEKQLR